MEAIRAGSRKWRSDRWCLLTVGNTWYHFNGDQNPKGCLNWMTGKAKLTNDEWRSH